MSGTEQIDLTKLRISREKEAPPDRPPRTRTWLPMYGAGAALIGLAFYFLYRSYFAAVPVVEVTTVTLTSPSQANALLTASGYVVAQRKASVASKATGRLVALGYEEGDRVKQGEIIARIESADVEASLAQARANLERTKADREDAERSLGRARQLFAGSLISQAELDGAKARFDRVVASIASDAAAVTAAEVQLENTRIRAPFDGTILTKNADIGEVVTPFAAGASSRVAVVTIADMNSLEVEADVSESNIYKIALKQPCEISLDAYPQKRYQGYVHKIVPTADRAKATVLTKIRFDIRDSSVLPEMSAKVYFLSVRGAGPSTASAKLTVNASAVTTRGGRKVVFRLREAAVEEVDVALGETFGASVEITSGLSEGDKVVLRPSDDLHHGLAVKLKQ